MTTEKPGRGDIDHGMGEKVENMRGAHPGSESGDIDIDPETDPARERHIVAEKGHGQETVGDPAAKKRGGRDDHDMKNLTNVDDRATEARGAAARQMHGNAIDVYERDQRNECHGKNHWIKQQHSVAAR